MIFRLDVVAKPQLILSAVVELWELKNSKMDNWNWKPRFDLDLAQRTLTIISISWLTRLVIQNSIFHCIGLSWIAEQPLDFCTVILIIWAFCKSSVQFNPDGKAVLITGKYQILT